MVTALIAMNLSNHTASTYWPTVVINTAFDLNMGSTYLVRQYKQIVSVCEFDDVTDVLLREDLTSGVSWVDDDYSFGDAVG